VSDTESLGLPPVRDAVADDAATIARVRIRTWQSAYAHVFPAAQLESLAEDTGLDWWRCAIAEPSPHMHTLVAEVDGAVAGFAQLGKARDEEGSTGELFAIYVLPEASGASVGRALMAETLARLRAERFADAILWVLEDNPRTHRFYELAGWRLDGGVKEEEWLGTIVRELRYRIVLGPTT
jgi:ribosomal protein S18 acetylase RimI-like enzyme